MESINNRIWNIMKGDSAIMHDLQRKIINTRALAKYLIANYSLSASLDAIISSIRRFPIDDYCEEDNVVKDVFKDSVVGTTNNVACVTIPLPAEEVCQKLNALGIIGFRIVTGTHAVKLIVKNSAAEKILNTFKKSHAQKNLSEISVVLPEKAIQTKGVMAKIASEIALANINITELIVCPPQFFIYVAEKDIVKAHERVLALTE